MPPSDNRITGRRCLGSPIIFVSRDRSQSDLLGWFLDRVISSLSTVPDNNDYSTRLRRRLGRIIWTVCEGMMAGTKRLRRMFVIHRFEALVYILIHLEKFLESSCKISCVFLFFPIHPIQWPPFDKFQNLSIDFSCLLFFYYSSTDILRIMCSNSDNSNVTHVFILRVVISDCYATYISIPR